MRQLTVFDLDGVLATIQAGPWNADNLSTAPVTEIGPVLMRLHQGHNLFVNTGRSENLRPMTTTWLEDAWPQQFSDLLMRPAEIMPSGRFAAKTANARSLIESHRGVDRVVFFDDDEDQLVRYRELCEEMCVATVLWLVKDGKTLCPM